MIHKGNLTLLSKFFNDEDAVFFLTSFSLPEDKFEYLEKRLSQEDKRYFRQLKYCDYLRTLYWSIIRSYVFFSRGKKCEKCNESRKLEVHHLSYDHLGEEYKYLNELIILCTACHKLNHIKNEEFKSIYLKKLKELVDKKTITEKLTPKVNPDYDPRILLNLKYFGDIRGAGWAKKDT